MTTVALTNRRVVLGVATRRVEGAVSTAGYGAVVPGPSRC